MFLDFFGRDRRPETLSQRDWDRFIQARRAGRAGRSGQPVGNRTIAWDLTFLMTVLNWAARSRDEEGSLLLDSNPLKGLRKPREKNPNRVVLTEDEYQALLKVSTGDLARALWHRRAPWREIDREQAVWTIPGSRMKAGRQHRVPLCDRALEILDDARKLAGGASPMVFAQWSAARRCVPRG